MRELSNKQRRAFCRAYLQCMDPLRAAARAGLEDGYALLETAEVQKELAWMRQAADRELKREDVLRGLARLAFATGEGLEAALAEEGTAGMDLSAAAEVKHSANGAVEIKLVDRIKALATLYELLGSGANEGAEAFFRALEEAGE